MISEVTGNDEVLKSGGGAEKKLLELINKGGELLKVWRGRWWLLDVENR